jgi:hypothetical protein
MSCNAWSAAPLIARSPSSSDSYIKDKLIQWLLEQFGFMPPLATDAGDG